MIPASIKEILNDSINAPSGDNSQPWRFKITGDKLLVLNDSEGDQTLYNFKQRGSYISIGAMIENIVLVSKKFGFDSNIEYFPNNADGAVASIIFTQSAPGADTLCEAITDRTTNRKPFKKRAIEEEHIAAIKDATSVFQDISVHIVTDHAIVEEIAELISLNERLILGNFKIHKFLFKYLRWSKEEEKSTPGLYIKTLEFNPFQEFMFKCFQSWSLVKIAQKIGVPKAISKQSASLYKASGGFVMITGKKGNEELFVRGGRILERLWLATTSKKISLQPTAALLYLEQRVHEGAAEDLSTEHQQEILKVCGKLRSIFNVGSQEMLMFARIGYDGEPTARSFKRPPIILA